MPDRLKSATVVSPAARVIVDAPDLRHAKAALEQVVVKQVGGDGFETKDVSVPKGELPRDTATLAADRADTAERRLHQALRVLRREADAQAPAAALDVLANDAVRLVVETAGWRRLAALALRGDQGSDDALKLHALLSGPTDLDTARAIATIAMRPLPDAAAAGPAAGKSAPASQVEVDSLLDALKSQDPSYGSLVRERLAAGAGMAEVSALLRQRKTPVDANPPPAAEVDRTDRAGLVFDLSVNKWVPVDKSWAYPVTLARVFEYEVDGIISGRQELTKRLIDSAVDPIFGKPLVDPEKISAFVDDLAAASMGNGPQSKALQELLSFPTEMCFSTTDGGSTPVRADWELPLQASAKFFAALNDPKLRADVHEAAQVVRAERAERRDRLTAPLKDLLAKYDGTPQRHKRAHAALINMGLAGQSFTEAQRDDGVLPRSRTLLSPETLRTQYADADNLKVRFLFNEDFETLVVSDELFAEVVKKYHFPPNHELLSYNSPIAGSGYLVIDHGKIIGLEDDTVMLPGKLGDNLPPALDVLKLQGFDLDEEGIAARSRVIDWEAVGKLKGKLDAPSTDAVDLGKAREKIMQAPVDERPKMVAQTVAQLLAHERAQGGQEDAVRARVSEQVAKMLEGFQLFNVSAADFRKGDLPPTLSEFHDLWVEGAVAESLVRRVAS